MANEIDERIVEMQFDNKQFSDGVQTTLKDLEDLKKGLKFDETVSGFERLDKAASNVNLNPLQNGIEVVQQRFSALEVIAISALSRITNQAMAAGESLIKSFTVDPVTSGFDKYESKVASVQKIINSSAENNIENVTAMLDKIEWFTNETSYQFDAMVSTLGSFSAAGIPLEQATDTIIGLANAAAISGVNAKDASHAFLGFQRAIGSGSLSLGIWNSYLKTAGFQSQKFIQGAIDAGVELNVLKRGLDGVARTAKGTEVSLESFGETLNEKWLNADVIKKLSENFSVATNQLYDAYTEFDGKKTTIELMDDMADSLDEYSLKAFKAGQETKTWGDAVEYVRGTVAQTWSKTFELIFGNYEEAKTFYSALVEDMYTIFVEANDNRNTFLEGWKEAGQVPFLNGLINSLKIVAHFVHLVNEGVKGFVENSGLAGFLTSLSLGFHSLTVRLGESLGVEGLATSIDEIAGAAKDVLGIEDEAVEKVKDGIEAANEVKEVVGDVAELAGKVIRGDFGNGTARRSALEALGYSYEAVQNKVNELLGCSFRYRDAEGKEITMDQALAASKVEVKEAMSGVGEEAEQTEESVNNLQSTFNGAVAILKIFGNAISAVIRVGAGVVGYIFKFGEGIVGITGSLGDLLTSVADYIDKNDLIFKGIKSVADAIADFLAPSLEKFVDLMDSLANRTNPFVKKLEEMRGNIENFAGSIQIFGDNSLFSKIKTNLQNSFGKLGEDISWLFSYISNAKIFEKAMGGIAVAIGAIGKAYSLASSIFNGKKIDIIDNENSIFGAIQKWYNEYGPKLPSFTKVWNDFWKSLIPKDSIWAYYDAFKKKGLQGILPKEGGIFGNITKFEKGYKDLKPLFDELFKDIQASSPILAKFTDGCNTIVDVFKQLMAVIWDLTKTGLGKLGELLSPLLDVFQAVADKIRSFPFDRVARFITLIGMFVLIYKALSAIKSITGFLDSFKGIGDAITGFLKSLERKAYASIALSVALAIGIIVGSLYALSKIPKEDLDRAIGGLIAVGLVLVGALYVFSLVAKADPKSVMFGVLAMAAVVASIGGIIAALYFLKDLKTEDYESGLARLALIFFALLGAMILISGAMKDRVIDVKSMAGLFLFVAALGKVLTVIKELAGMPFAEMLQGILGLYAVTGALVILATGLSGLKFQNSLGLAALVGAVWLFVQLLKNIAEEDIITLTIGVLKLIPAFMGMWVLAKLASKAGKDFLGFAAVILATAVGLKLIGEAIADLGALGGVQLIKGGLAVTAIMAALTVMMHFISNMSFYDKNGGADAAKALLGMAAAIFVIALAIKILAGLEFGEAMTAMIALGGVILAVGKALKLAENTLGKGGAKVLLSFAVLIGVIAASLYVLSMIPWTELLPAAGSLAVVIAAVGFAVKRLSSMNMKSALSVALSMGLVIAAVVAALWFLNTLNNADALLKNAEAMTLIIVAVGGMIVAATKILGGDMAIGAKMIVIAGELGAAIDAFVIMLGGLAYLAGKFVDAEALERGLNMFVTFFERIGEMVGGLFGGVIKGFTDPLPQAGKNMSDFATNMQKFVDAFNNNNWVKIAGAIASFAEAMKKLKGVNLNGYDFTGYSAAMSSLATGFSTFDQMIKETSVDVNKADKAATAIQTLAEVLSDPIVFDSAKWDNFGTAIQSLGSSLVSFSETISAEGAFDEDKIGKFISVFNRVITMAQRMGSLEGFSGFEILTGTTDANGLDGLARLAQSVISFNQKIGPDDQNGALNVERVTTAIDMIGQLADAANKLPTNSSKASTFIKTLFSFTGANYGGMADKAAEAFDSGPFTWDVLSNGLSGLGGALVEFSEKTKDLDVSESGGLSKGLAAIKQFTELDINKSVAGQVEKFIIGDNTLGGFADSITNLGSGLLGFYNNTKDLDSEKLGPSLEMINTILGIPKAFEEAGITSDDGGVAISLSTWGSNLETFAERFVSALSILDEYASNHMDEDGGFSITKTIGSLFESLSSMWEPGTAENLQSIGEEIAKAIATGLSADNDIVAGAARTLGGYIRTGIFGEGEGTEGGSEKFVKTGEEVAKLISDGLGNSTSKARAEEKAKYLRGAMSLVFSSKESYDMFYHGGENLANGLIQGFLSKKGEAESAAREVANSMNTEFQKAEDSHSPSRVWEGYGENLINGLTNRIYAMTGNAVASVRYLAKAMNGEMQNSNSFRISPVIDMNGATRSASQLNTLFDANRAAALNATMEVNSQVTQFDQLVDLTNQILGSIQNGSDLYLDDSILAGRINRRLGAV